MSSLSFLDIIERHRAISYANVSAMVVLIYDFFQTLDVEIDYIWHSPWTVTKRSYLSMRCLQFFYVSVLLLDDHWTVLNDSTCLGLEIAYWGAHYPLERLAPDMTRNPGLALLAFGASELILTLRTWILWGKQRWVAKMLITFNFVLHIAGLIIISLTFSFTTYDTDFPDQSWVGCVLRSRFNTLWANWVLLIIYDAVLCTLLASRAYQEFKAERISPSVMRIYQEAIMYYLCIFVLDLPGLLSAAILRDELFPILSPSPLIVRQLLTARVVLYSWKRGNSHSDYECYTYALTTLDH